jgi:hypothetical protein
MSSLRKIDTAYAVMDEFMDNTILKGKNEARLMPSTGKTAELLGDTVFSRLIAASEKEAESGTGLNDSELVWKFLVIILRYEFLFALARECMGNTVRGAWSVSFTRVISSTYFILNQRQRRIHYRRRSATWLYIPKFNRKYLK